MRVISIGETSCSKSPMRLSLRFRVIKFSQKYSGLQLTKLTLGMSKIVSVLEMAASEYSSNVNLHFARFWSPR